MRFATAFFILANLLPSQNALSLPDEVVALITKQTPEFEERIKVMTPAQLRLMLERYADLLTVSSFTEEMQVSRTELLDYLVRLFIVQDVAEAEQKKAKEDVLRKDIAQDAKKLMDTFHGRVRGGVLHLHMECHGQVYELPLSISTSQIKNAWDLILYGVYVPQSGDVIRETRCLSLFLAPSEDASVLEWIGTKDSACSVPANKAGACLLDFAEKAVKATGRSRLMVSDGSKITCAINKDQTPLWQLKIYQTGQTWYESKGYRYIDEGPEKRVEAVKEARRYTITELIDNLKSLQASDEKEHVRALMSQFLPKFRELQRHDTVAEFMSWLWIENCAAYSAINDFITLRSFKSKYSEIFPVTGRFEKVLGR